MWIAQIIIGLCLIVIGFLCGIMCEGMSGNNEELFKMNRRIHRLERRLNGDVIDQEER